MHELDAAGVDDLVRIYQAAADEVRGRINAAVDNTDRESSLQALERLSPEVRAGAIVQTSEAQPVQSLPPHHAGESSDRPRYPLWHVDGSNTKGLNRVFPERPWKVSNADVVHDGSRRRLHDSSRLRLAAERSLCDERKPVPGDPADRRRRGMPGAPSRLLPHPVGWRNVARMLGPRSCLHSRPFSRFG